jgi:hypothetical protein
MGLSDLPLASGDKHAACFVRFGWIRDPKRRGRGTHILPTEPGVRATLSIPNHREVKRTIIAELIKLAGIDQAEYLEKFKK